MKSRLLVALLGIPLLAYIYLQGGLFLLLFVNVIVGIALFEFYRMAEVAGNAPYKKIGIVTGLLIPNVMYFIKNPALGEIEILVLMTMGIMIYRVFKNQVENASKEIGVTVLGVLYVSILFSHMLLISRLEKGGEWIFALQILVWVCDSFAYFTGVKFGRKFFKNGFSQISPKKSVEGSLGGIVFTVLCMFLINYYTKFFHGNGSIIKMILFSVVISLAVQVGDLAESMFKREFKVKDSGGLLGEHGGILDRFDSLIFVLPIAYFLITTFIQ